MFNSSCNYGKWLLPVTKGLNDKVRALYIYLKYMFNSSHSRVDKTSAYGAVDTSLIPRRTKPMISKLIFTASLLDAQHQRNSVENKPVSLPVVSFGKTLSEIRLSEIL